MLQDLLGGWRPSPVIGVDISSSTVKVLELSRNDGRYRVESFAVAPLPQNAVVEKNITDTEVVAETLRLAYARSRSKQKNAAVAVSGAAVITKVIEMSADLKEEVMETQITLEADQYIPYPLEEVALDFEVIGPSERNEDMVEVLLAASRQENIDTRVEVLELAGLEAKVVDIEAFAMERSFALLAEQFRRSRLVAFSTGNVYPMVSVNSNGADESVPPDPIGEYGITGLGRERLLEYVSHRHQTPVCLLRLNYAVELRYGVPVDIAQRLLAGEPVDLSTSHVNLVWQGYANAVALAAFGLAASPAEVLNLTGPGVLPVRDLAEGLAKRLNVTPTFSGKEGTTALLNDASRCLQRFGQPELNVEQILDLVADWLQAGLPVHGKPTKFQVRDGKF